MKLGISIKIDETKIDKDRLFKGKKGTYLDLTTFIDTDNPGQYGDHGSISQSVSKEEREAKVRLPILGNCTVFWQGESDAGDKQQEPAGQPAPGDDIPF